MFYHPATLSSGQEAWTGTASCRGASAQDDMGEVLGSLCFPVYVVQNITFFKIYLQFAQIENGYKLQPIRLGKIIDSLPHGPRSEV